MACGDGLQHLQRRQHRAAVADAGEVRVEPARPGHCIASRYVRRGALVRGEFRTSAGVASAFRTSSRRVRDNGRMPSRPSVLLFDLGGVLVDFSGIEDLRPLLPEALDDEALLARWAACPHSLAYGAGQLTTDAVHAAVPCGTGGLPWSRPHFRAAWQGWVRGWLPGAADADPGTAAAVPAGGAQQLERRALGTAGTARHARRLRPRARIARARRAQAGRRRSIARPCSASMCRPTRCCSSTTAPPTSTLPAPWACRPCRSTVRTLSVVSSSTPRLI